MDSLKNMACNLIRKNKKFKKFYLEIRLKKLQSKIENEIESIIYFYPKEAARMDVIENNFPSSSIPKIRIEISATQKLLDNIYKN